MSFLYADKSFDGPNLPYIPPNSPEGAERAKWDRSKSQGGMRCDGFEPYPKTLYQAGRPKGTNIEISGSVTVRSEAEERMQLGQGWCATQVDAIAQVQAAHVEHAKLAAERAHAEQFMSEGAQREAARFDGETVQHVPVIPETPVRRRPGRPAKVAS